MNMTSFPFRNAVATEFVQKVEAHASKQAESNPQAYLSGYLVAMIDIAAEDVPGYEEFLKRMMPKNE